MDQSARRNPAVMVTLQSTLSREGGIPIWQLLATPRHEDLAAPHPEQDLSLRGLFDFEGLIKWVVQLLVLSLVRYTGAVADCDREAALSAIGLGDNA